MSETLKKSLESLPLPEGVTLTELAPDYPALQIETPACSATLALHGAHLTHWQPRHTPHPVLYTSPTAIYKEGKAIRGGIPLCWPWFNAHPTAPDQHPSHGIARNRFWQLSSVSRAGDEITIQLTLTRDKEVATHVPFDCSLTASFRIGTSLEASLFGKNLSSQPVRMGGALHSYFTVSDISNITLTGLQNTPFIDTTQTPETTQNQHEEKLTIAAETDRIYYGTRNKASLHDSEWQRRINISGSDSLTTVVWNPWQEKAAALTDLPDEDYRRFLCVETANARHDARVILPSKKDNPSGPSQHLSTTLTVD